MCNSEMDLGLEASKYKNPRFDIVSRIAYLLGVSEEYFLGEESLMRQSIRGWRNVKMQGLSGICVLFGLHY